MRMKYTLNPYDFKAAIPQIHSHSAEFGRLQMTLTTNTWDELRSPFIRGAVRQTIANGFYLLMVMRVDEFTEKPEEAFSKYYKMLDGLDTQKVSFVRFTSPFDANAGDTRNAAILIGGKLLSDPRLAHIKIVGVSDDNKSTSAYVRKEKSIDGFKKVENLLSLSQDMVVGALPSRVANGMSSLQRTNLIKLQTETKTKGREPKDLIKMMQIWLMSPATLQNIVKKIQGHLGSFALPIFEDYAFVSFLKKNGFDLLLTGYLSRTFSFKGASASQKRGTSIARGPFAALLYSQRP